MINQVRLGTSDGSLQCKVMPSWFNDGIYRLVHSLLYCPSAVGCLRKAARRSTKEAGIPDAEKAKSPLAVFLWKGKIVAQLCGTENAPCQPIVAEVACEAG